MACGTGIRYPGLSCDNDSYCYLPLLEEMQFFPSKKFADGLRYGNTARASHDDSSYIEGRCFTHASMHCVGMSRPTGGASPRIAAMISRAQFVIMALGPINTPKVPRVPGLDDFQGTMFHTARWDYEYTGGNQDDPILDKLDDKRVAIVGTGASAIQAVPFLGDTPSSSMYLQRTASTVDERRNTRTDPKLARNTCSPAGSGSAR